jgi:hypothetical protein
VKFIIESVELKGISLKLLCQNSEKFLLFEQEFQRFLIIIMVKTVKIQSEAMDTMMTELIQ